LAKASDGRKPGRSKIFTFSRLDDASRLAFAPDTPLDPMDTTKSQPSTAAVAISANAPGGAEGSTNFFFENKVFSLQRGFFSMTRDTKEPVFNVMLGELQATLPLPTLRSEFNITPESPDGRLLGLIEESLRFVKEIRPNDSIPRELLDGSASWTVENRHRLIAQSRLALQVSSWLTGEATVSGDLSQLQQLAEDPATKQRVQNAIGEIAEHLGIGRANKRQVMDKIDQFSREFSYIEALRERCAAVKRVNTTLARLMKIYRIDKSVVEDIVRVVQLLREPSAEFNTTFDFIDAQTAQILDVLKRIDEQVKFVRDMRDELHCRLMKWDELLAKWEALEVVRSPEAEALIKETYRFAAHHFPQMQKWRR
jgi:hypothetical protein